MGKCILRRVNNIKEFIFKGTHIHSKLFGIHALKFNYMNEMNKKDITIRSNNNRILLSRLNGLTNRILLPIYYLTAKRFRVIGQSMEPVINEGEQVFITKMYYKLNKIKRNDIIGLYNNQKIEIKKIIGIPEDRLLINQSSLVRNGTEIINTNNIQQEIQNKEITLRNEEFFVMGENYSKSVDSRNYGPIKKNQIIGKVLGR